MKARTLDTRALVPRTAFLFLLFASLPAGALAQSPERWQVTLATGQILYELYPESLAADTLVLRQGGAARRIALADLSELRRVRASVELAERAGRNAIAALSGADDEVYQMTLLDVGEKRTVVGEILAALARPAPLPSE
jgi:hypothetical protein